MSDLDAVPAFVIHGGDLMAVITCNCRLGNRPMILSSAKLEVVCVHCQHAYGFSGASYSQEEGLRLGIGRREMQTAKPGLHLVGKPGLHLVGAPS